MIKLLAIEWLKVKRYRTFWVLIVLFVVLFPLLNMQIASGMLRIGGDGKNGINFLNTAYSFPQVWGNLGFWGSLFILFISILIIILTTNEYTYRTNRQNVIDGWSRMQFFHGKVALVVVLSFLATVYLFVLGAIFGTINSGSAGGLFIEFQQVGYFFLLSVDYLGFALLIALWIRRSGLAIGLFLLYSFIIENILRSILNHFTDRPFGNLLPLQASDELLPFPLMQMAKAMMPAGSTLSMTVYASVAVLWCVVYYVAGRALLLRNDW
jgi:ABC-2 type transport system permease protein